MPKKTVRGDLRLHSDNGKFYWKPQLKTQFVTGMEFRLIDALTIRGSIPIAPLKAKPTHIHNRLFTLLSYVSVEFTISPQWMRW